MNTRDCRHDGSHRILLNPVGAVIAGLVLLGLASPGAAQVMSQDYAQWRGPNRDGSAALFSAPSTWPETLTLKWKVDVGPGYATPIVIGPRVYSFSRQNGEEVMMALDAATGKSIWRTAYAAPYKMNPATMRHGEGPKSTPLHSGGKLFTLGITGIVSAFDASSGKLLWQKPAPPVEPLFGTAMSPAAEGDLVIFHVGGHDQGALTAFDVATGAVKWAWSGDGPGYGSPMIVTIGGTRQVITGTQAKIVGLELATGKLLWEHPFVARSTTNSFTPIIHNNTVIVSAHDAGVAALRPVKRNDQWSVEAVWDTTDVEMKLSNPVVVGDTLYGLSHKNSGQLFGLDPNTGEVLWRGKEREALHSSIVKTGDLLFFLNDDAKLTVAKGSRTGLEPLRTYTVAESATWAQPTLSGNRIFVKDVSNLALWTVN